MDDAVAMRVVEGLGELEDQGEAVVQRSDFPAEPR